MTKSEVIQILIVVFIFVYGMILYILLQFDIELQQRKGEY